MADESGGLSSIFHEPGLLAPPVRRAAYSDRTAWLMSAMAELAYFRFEGGQDFLSFAKDLASISAAGDIEDRLRKFLRQIDIDTASGKEQLENILNLAGFKLINVYNIADTQGFLAERIPEKSEDKSSAMRVLAFRGTEKKLADIKTDIRANLITPENTGADEKIHQGFYEAFIVVQEKIESDLSLSPELPLYITGHSLGGALAVVATRLIASDSLGACYTFGGPRVGNIDMALSIKTPIYRVVNAADGVPRLPPAWAVPVLIAILNWIPAPLGWLTSFLKRFQGYVHFGDMRYLNHVEAGHEDEFKGLRLISNPSLPLRARWAIQRLIATFGRAGVSDHSRSLYRRKLKAYAIKRN